MGILNSRPLTASAIALACSLGFAQAGLAQGKGHGGNNANSNGINATDRDTGADRAGDRMSTQGLANTNGPDATDRDKGKARANDRLHK